MSDSSDSCEYMPELPASLKKASREGKNERKKDNKKRNEKVHIGT